MMEILSIMMMLSKKKYTKLFIQNSIFMLTLNSLLMMENMNLETTNIFLFMYIDKYSLMLIIMNLWISAMLLMITKKNKMMIIMTLMIIIMFTFSSSSMFMFYIWFEMSLIPLFIMIFWWSKTKERSLASMYMLIYTMTGSLPLLMSILFIYKNSFSMEWEYLMMFNLKKMTLINYWNMIVAFLIKIPVFGFHIWLPKAHVEAPVYGSMILASIILKMGSMGLMRIMMVSVESSMSFNSYLMMIMMSGVLFMSMLCILQSDMKSIVAYSSVVHMGMTTISMMTLFKWGFSSAYIMLIGHGLCSSSMFYIVNIMYSRSNTRMIFMNKGLINMNPSLTMMWFFSCISNMSAPISINFFSELMMSNTIIAWSINLIFMLMLINMMSSIYSMNLFLFTYHGKMYMCKMKPIKMIEYHTIMLHLLPLYLMSMNSWTWNMNF